MRRRPRQEPLHAHGQCQCSRSAIPDIPWATRKTRGMVARPSHNAAAHFTSCPHSTLAASTRMTVAEARRVLAGRGKRRKRRPIARVVLVPA